jgi:hypothetical protein
MIWVKQRYLIVGMRSADCCWEQSALPACRPSRCGLCARCHGHLPGRGFIYVRLPPSRPCTCCFGNPRHSAPRPAAAPDVRNSFHKNGARSSTETYRFSRQLLRLSILSVPDPRGGRAGTLRISTRGSAINQQLCVSFFPKQRPRSDRRVTRFGRFVQPW